MAYNFHPHQKPLAQLSCRGLTVLHQASDLFTLQLESASGGTSRCGVGGFMGYYLWQCFNKWDHTEDIVAHFQRE